MFGLVILIFLASFMPQFSLIAFRFTVGAVPVNFLEATLCFAYAYALLSSKHMRNSLNHLWESDFRPSLLSLLLISLYGLIHGYSNENIPYEIVRDFRAVVLIIASYFLTITIVRSPSSWKLATSVIIIGGLCAMVRLVLFAGTVLSEAVSYMELRLGNASAGMELASTFLFSVFVMNYKMLKSRILTWSCFVLCVSSALLTFSLSAYAMLALIPAITLILAPMVIARNIVLVRKVVVLIIALGILVLGSVIGDYGADDRVFGQIIQQLLHPEESPHFRVRERGWMGTIASLDGFTALVGNGFGTRSYIESESSGEEGGILAEATYAQYLNYVGLVGLATLISLNVRFVVVGLQAGRKQLTAYQQTTVLAITVYGVINVINGFLHNNLMSPLNSVLYGTLMGLLSVIKSSLFSFNPLACARKARSEHKLGLKNADSPYESVKR